MNKVQQKKPIRTCKKSYTNYRSFKSCLRDDFNKRCGYCDDLDRYTGGKRNYQIDHFRPCSIEKFKNLKANYNNLIYACSFCNRAKWNKWKDINGFIDPCEDEYDHHLTRNNQGQIEYKTEQGSHEFLWCTDRLKEQKQMLLLKINTNKSSKKLLQQFKAIQDKIDEYTELV